MSRLWWLNYAMSYFCFYASKCENGKTRRDDTIGLCRLFVFSLFSDFRGNKAKIRQKDGEYTKHKICRIFAFHLSSLRIFTFSPCNIFALLHCCISSFSHCYIYAFWLYMGTSIWIYLNVTANDIFVPLVNWFPSCSKR
jgi:glucan phosphoethanolaminetransferase (alkaline phosphatase superfamily)